MRTRIGVVRILAAFLSVGLLAGVSLGPLATASTPPAPRTLAGVTEGSWFLSPTVATNVTNSTGSSGFLIPTVELNEAALVLAFVALAGIAVYLAMRPKRKRRR
jgi:hypothetical protein